MDKLQLMRDEIDAIDERIIALLASRFQVTEKVGFYKAENALAATDLNREEAQFAKFRQLALQHDLDEKLVENLYKQIIETVVSRHKRMIN